jgi:hypothetical protein
MERAFMFTTKQYRAKAVEYGKLVGQRPLRMKDVNFNDSK